VKAWWKREREKVLNNVDDHECDGVDESVSYRNALLFRTACRRLEGRVEMAHVHGKG
jgi:hypothetical protein